MAAVGSMMATFKSDMDVKLAAALRAQRKPVRKKKCAWLQILSSVKHRSLHHTYKHVRIKGTKT